MKERVQQTMSVLVPRGASNIRVDINEAEGRVDIFFDNTGYFEAKVEYLKKYCFEAKLSKLSKEDKFLEYEPETYNQESFKSRLIRAIDSGLSDIIVPYRDLSIDEEGKLCFSDEKRVASGKTGEWWKKNAIEFMPKNASRLGSTNERIAFMGLCIKTLIEEYGFSVKEAWYAVCERKRDFNNKKNWPFCKYDIFENMYKITSDEYVSDGLNVVYYTSLGFESCVALMEASRISKNGAYSKGTGWVVLTKW